MSERALVALGSNLGSRAGFLAAARSQLSLLRATRLTAVTRVEETAPLGAVAQGPYLNQMVSLDTTLSPLALLRSLQQIERALGRVRRARWGARTIDLDIVRHGEREMRHPSLVLPHPGIESRAFWQREIAELEAVSGSSR